MFMIMVMPMSMSVHFLRFFVTIDPYGDMRALNSAFEGYIAGNRDTGNPGMIQFGEEFLFVREKLQ